MLQWDEIFSIVILPQQNKQSFIFLKKNFAFSIYLLLTIEFLSGGGHWEDHTLSILCDKIETVCFDLRVVPPHSAF